MKPQIPWLRVFVEGVVIVGSILLAFGLQAWWDAQQNLAEERRVLEALEGEFESNRETLQELILDHETWRGSLDSFYSTPVERLLGMDADSLVRGVVAGFRMGITYDPSVGALQTLVSGGRIGILRSTELENALWAWQRQLVDSEEEAAFIIGTVNESLGLMRALGVMDPRTAFLTSGRTAVERLWSSGAMASQAVILGVWRGSYIGELKNLLALTNSVLELIRRDD